MSSVEVEMITVTFQERDRSVAPHLREVGVRVKVQETFAVRNEKIKKKKRVAKKNVERAARRMIEWEAEEASGDESFDSVE